MDGRILALTTVRHPTVVELHLSTLGGLHVIHSNQREPGTFLDRLTEDVGN